MSGRGTFWQGRRVLLTGHTGFKGGWLALWLQRLGAQVYGYALDPVVGPSLFAALQLDRVLAGDTRADLLDRGALAGAFQASSPQIVFHLAAQPLVRESYRTPLATMSTNVIGTANVLEAARASSSVEAVVVITTDKVYLSRENAAPFREDDPLGGHDPYSASKAAAEIVTASFRSSFFAGAAAARIATARAGNVIGGGDWSADRLVPDCLRSFGRSEAVQLRYPQAIRPWQHVLEPLSGYLLLAEQLCSAEGSNCAGAWNFGPDRSGDMTVGNVAAATAALWGGDARVVHAPSAADPHETAVLRLDSTRARNELGWQPRWSVDKALARTVSWHRAWLQSADMSAVSLQQIAEYEGAVAS